MLKKRSMIIIAVVLVLAAASAGVATHVMKRPYERAEAVVPPLPVPDTLSPEATPPPPDTESQESNEENVQQQKPTAGRSSGRNSKPDADGQVPSAGTGRTPRPGRGSVQIGPEGGPGGTPGGRPPMERRQMFSLDFLKLTPEQKTRVDKIMAETRASMEELRGKELDREERRNRIKDIMEEQDHKLSRVLTTEQMAALQKERQEMRERIRERMRERMQGGEGGTAGTAGPK